MERRTSVTPFEVQLLREGLVESVHRVYAVVADRRGRALASAGDRAYSIFSRSALKPFQALAAVRAGVNLTAMDLAILCSSHSGTTQHCRQVFNILWQADLETRALCCPTPGSAKTPLAHNCSGKHAGMLLACRARNWPLEDYTSARHPLQQYTAQVLAELLGMPVAELISARDDCTAPTYQITLTQLAMLYAKLTSGEDANLESLARAMNRYPERVAGEGRFDSILMAEAPMLVSKGGAEGVQCIGHLGEGMGLAVKVLDGSERAKYPVVIQILQQLGWIDPTQAQSLLDRFAMINSVKRLEVMGELIFP
jgi:L-asparaginase